MHEGHGDALYAVRLELLSQRRYRALVEGETHLAMDVDAFRHRETPRARHQRPRLLDGEVVLVVAALVGDIEHVAEALGGDQRRAGASPLDDGVGGERRAMHEHCDVAEALARVLQDQADTVEHRLLRPLWRRQQLAREAPVAFFEHHIRERAADVDGYAQVADHVEKDPPYRKAARP
jgi:hypothetical protein